MAGDPLAEFCLHGEVAVVTGGCSGLAAVCPVTVDRADTIAAQPTASSPFLIYRSCLGLRRSPLLPYMIADGLLYLMSAIVTARSRKALQRYRFFPNSGCPRSSVRRSRYWLCS